MTDGTFEANREFRQGVGLYYDLVKANVQRLVVALTHELRDHPVTALGGHSGLDPLRGDARALRGHRGHLA